MALPSMLNLASSFTWHQRSQNNGRLQARVRARVRARVKVKVKVRVRVRVRIRVGTYQGTSLASRFLILNSSCILSLSSSRCESSSFCNLAWPIAPLSHRWRPARVDALSCPSSARWSLRNPVIRRPSMILTLFSVVSTILATAARLTIRAAPWSCVKPL